MNNINEKWPDGMIPVMVGRLKYIDKEILASPDLFRDGTEYAGLRPLDMPANSWVDPETGAYGTWKECTHQNQVWMWETDEKGKLTWLDRSVCTACGKTGIKTDKIGELGQRSENVN